MCGGYSDFQTLAYSRHSVRDFSDKPLSVEQVKKAVKLAQTAPSACNRQSSRIIHVIDREKCEKILNIQGGAKGHSITELRRILSISKNMHVIAVIQIGEHRENSVHAISHRRPVEDVFVEI